MRPQRFVLPALLSLLMAVPVQAQVDYTIIVKDPAWLPSFTPLVDCLGEQGYQAEALCLPDGAAARAHIQLRQSALTPSGRMLLGMLVEDPSVSQQFDLQQIHSPELAGADLGWGEYVPSWDNYNDFDGDHVPETAIWPLPAQSSADCAAYVAKAIAWHRGETPLSHVATASFLCEDVDRGGRSGDLVREHGQTLLGLWQHDAFLSTYQGDDYPTEYPLREAVADALDNAGHQFKFTLGTTANKSNLVNFQDIRQDPPWSEQHLEADRGLYAHFALSCAHLAIDRPDQPDYGRPIVERVTFLADRGAYVTLGMTRQGYQYSFLWLGEALIENIRPVLLDGAPCRAGDAWQRARRDFLIEHPEHAVEAASFYGIGDPALAFRSPLGSAVAAGEVGEPALRVLANPNPFNPGTRISITLPAAGPAGLDIFDLSGRRVATLLPHQWRAAGSYAATWDGRTSRGGEAASGVYFVRLRVAGSQRSHKITLLR